MVSSILTADGMALAKDYIRRVLSEIKDARESVDFHCQEVEVAAEQARVELEHLDEYLKTLSGMLIQDMDLVGDGEVSDV